MITSLIDWPKFNKGIDLLLKRDLTSNLMTKDKLNPNLILPEGTQVVTLVEVRDLGGKALRRKGAVGKITKSPTDNKHSYIVQFLDGKDASLHRQEIAIRKQIQNINFDNPNAAMVDRELEEHIIYSCIVGSRAYGLENESSDTDRRGIFLPPAELHWSLYGVPEQIEDSKTDECYWEIQKFLVLTLKANPNVLECLYSPMVETVTPLAQELLDNRNRFLSQLVYQTYNGYVLSQFRKLEADMRQKGEPKWKHVMHLIRLLLSGINVLSQGSVLVEVGHYKEKLLDIRFGRIPFDEINNWRLELHKEFDQAYENTKLPERPDYEWANNFLIKARREKV